MFASGFLVAWTDCRLYARLARFPAAAKTPLPHLGTLRVVPPSAVIRWRRGRPNTRGTRQYRVLRAVRQAGIDAERGLKVRSGTDCATRSLPSRPTPRVSVYTVMILLGQESRARPTHALTCRARSCRCSVTRSGRWYTEDVEPKAITARTRIRIRRRTRRRNRDVLLVWRSTCTERCGTCYLEVAHHIYCGVGQRLIVEMPRAVPALKPQLQVVHADRKQRQ